LEQNHIAPSEINKRNTFSKALGRTDILALGFGTMVGWSWVMVTTTWVNEAGFWGAIIAFLAGASIILLVGLSYGELTSALPLAGGEIVYVYRAMGKQVAWLVGWIMAFAYIAVAAWESIAISTALDYLLPIPSFIHLWDVGGAPVYLSWALVGMFGAIAMTLLNLFATRPAIIFQVMATAGFILIGFILLFGGVTFGSTDNMVPLIRDINGLTYVVLMVPSMLVGFDVIPQSAEEMNIPLRDVGRMVVVCIIFACIWYVMIIVGVTLAAPFEIRSSGLIPAADVMTYAYGDPFFGKIVIMGGLLGILTCWNGFFMGASRLLFAMGRAKMLPAVFGRLHKTHQTPWAATLMVGVICILSPLLGKNAFVWLVNASAFCALFGYFIVSGSFVILRWKEPDLSRPFKLRGGKFIGWGALIFSGLYFILFVSTTVVKSWSEELLFIFVWIIVGIILLVITHLQVGRVSDTEREVLIFGEEFSRKTHTYKKSSGKEEK
jgi:amino acid transporter